MGNSDKAGGTVLHVVIRPSGATARTVVLASGVNRIGRNPANDICLDDTTVSGRHCEIVVLDKDVFVRDLGSTNGTFIDGQSIKEAALLPGQTLHVGSVEVVLERPVQISIPQLSFPQQTNPFLPDGSASCVNHPASYATLECTRCEKAFCDLCVHQVRRVGGAALTLCPSCSGHCRPILPETPEKKRKSRFVTWIGKVTAKITGRLVRTNGS